MKKISKKMDRKAKKWINFIFHEWKIEVAGCSSIDFSII
jgi:hypothetical protein